MAQEADQIYFPRLWPALMAHVVREGLGNLFPTLVATIDGPGGQSNLFPTLVASIDGVAGQGRPGKLISHACSQY
jgi:hypothetical protein